jgi:hypothetical protein
MVRAASTLSTEQLAQLLRIVRGADSVELKLSVPDADRRSAVAALDLDLLDAQLRQVVFFDTPDLGLSRHGVVVRARRVQRKSGDSVVKLRPLQPEDIPKDVRGAPGFNVEVDAMPGGFVCSGALKEATDNGLVRDVVAGRHPIRKLFTKQQRALFARYAPDGLALDALAVLGPINVLKLRFTPPELDRRLVAELWTYPDGSRILELSTKCETTEVFEVGVRTRTFLAEKGIDLLAEQQTKTRTALEFFAAELAGGNGAEASGPAQQPGPPSALPPPPPGKGFAPPTAAPVSM